MVNKLFVNTDFMSQSNYLDFYWDGNKSQMDAKVWIGVEGIQSILKDMKDDCWNYSEKDVSNIYFMLCEVKKEFEKRVQNLIF